MGKINQDKNSMNSQLKNIRENKWDQNFFENINKTDKSLVKLEERRNKTVISEPKEETAL